MGDALQQLGWKKEEFGIFKLYTKGIMEIYVYMYYAKIKCTEEHSELNYLTMKEIEALNEVMHNVAENY